MLPLIDILTLHCPLTPSSRNMISTGQLRMMKKGSVLVNLSRGAVVDEVALADELRRNKMMMQELGEYGERRVTSL